MNPATLFTPRKKKHIYLFQIQFFPHSSIPLLAGCVFAEEIYRDIKFSLNIFRFAIKPVFLSDIWF